MRGDVVQGAGLPERELELQLRLANAETERVRQLVTTHNRVHDLIARAAPLGDVLTELAQGIERYDPSVIPCIVLLDRATSTLHPGAGPSLPPHYLAAIDGVVIGPNIGACGSAAWSGRLTISHDIETDPRWAPIRDFVMDAGLRHCWSMPIKAADGEVLGTLALYGPQPRQPLPEQLALMEDGARLAGIAIERHRAMERLIHDARHDGLTGLPNRTAIFEHLDDAIVRIRPETQVGVLFVDLDGLKMLNDSYGHDRADELLREIGERLASSVRAGDFVGRFGGDEFVVIAEGIADAEEAGELGFRLLEAVSEPLPGLDVDRRHREHRHHVDGRERRRRARGDPPGRPRHVRRQALRPRPLQLLRGQPPHARRPPPLPGARAARRGDARRDEHRLPARLRRREHRAVAVEALLRWTSPDARRRHAGRVHPGGRGHRGDRAAGSLGPARELRDARARWPATWSSA